MLAGLKPDCRTENSSKVSNGNTSEGDFSPEPRPRMGRRRKQGLEKKYLQKRFSVFPSCLPLLPLPGEGNNGVYWEGARGGGAGEGGEGKEL